MPTIAEIENEIVEEFQLLEGDREAQVEYIMELGARLDKLEESAYQENNLVKGCQSKVWLVSGLDNTGHVAYRADSNTAITKGLVSLLIRVLNRQPAEAISRAELTFLERIGMGSLIGSQRSNGLAAMVRQMKLFAIALQAQQQQAQQTQSTSPHA